MAGVVWSGYGILKTTFCLYVEVNAALKVSNKVSRIAVGWKLAVDMLVYYLDVGLIWPPFDFVRWISFLVFLHFSWLEVTTKNKQQEQKMSSTSFRTILCSQQQKPPTKNTNSVIITCIGLMCTLTHSLLHILTHVNIYTYTYIYSFSKLYSLFM